jgi:FG-GAP-like repeat/Abnormal spindle-like microcephaly-assoc'd, ASPM-SPD-2-Hydin
VLDLVVPNQSDAYVSILLGNGDGTFRSHVDYFTPGAVWRGGVADVNGDGKLDLVLTTWAFNGDELFVLLGKGDGTFQKAQTFVAGSCPLGAAFGDFNNDGILDIVIGDQCSTLSVMLGAAVSLQPDTLAFGAVSVSHQSSLSTQLTNIVKSTLNIQKVSISGGKGAFSQTNNCGSVGAGQSCTITVTFAPQAAGTFNGQVAIWDNAPGSPQLVYLNGSAR